MDLYNEGVDLPTVDTLLFLRPTQSSLLFQQQLGRGLRLSPGKSSCLVLDFVGQHRTDFRFDRLLSAITGFNRRELLDGVKDGFSSLPSGCHIHLESQAREQVLKSLRAVVNQSWRHLKSEVQSYATLRGRRDFTLSEFIHDQQVDLDEVFRESKPSGWTTLRREAGLLEERPDATAEAALSRSMRYVLHVNDPGQLSVMKRVAERGAAYRAESAGENVRAQMLAYQMEPKTVQSYSAFVRELAAEPNCLRELGELTAILESRTRVMERPVPGLEDVPLVLHGSYESREILTAVGKHSATDRPMFREGVLPLADRQVELLFVTLDKSSGYHERITYHDYAISPTQFHWQTQNSAGPHTTVGKRYLESLTNGWRFQLFVRPNKRTAYTACGPVHITEAEDISGDRPMNIRWTLEVALPIALFREFSVLRVGE